MSLYLNNNHITEVIYNDTNLEQLNYNGVDVWYKVNNSPSASLTAGTLHKAYSFGTRTPADKISNYVIINSESLIQGKKYGYILGTSGERTGNRLLYDGRVITSRAYNSGYTEYVDSLTVNNFVNGGYYINAEVSDYGSFTYNISTITAGDGSTAQGFKLAGYTYNVSDPGKGGAIAFIYPYEYLHDLCILNNKSFS